MRRLDNSLLNLLHINSNIHNVVALALICVGNDISLDWLAFQANSLVQSTKSVNPPPHPPNPSHPSPRRLMKKTSAGVKKVACPVRHVSVLPLTGFGASGVAGPPVRQQGWAEWTFLAASLHSQLEATTLLSSTTPPPCLRFSLPSLSLHP